MKLNLLPTSVSKGQQAKVAWFGATLLALVGILGLVFMITASKASLEAARTENANLRPQAQAVVDTAAKADAVIQQAQGILTNTALSKAMQEHNGKYPDLYNSLMPYIPPFYRINSISASPSDAQTSTITLVGSLSTYQQYADLALALMRYPNALSVTRAGFQDDMTIVPSLDPLDQTGRPRRPSQGPIPDDPLQRLSYYQAQARTQSFLGTGNFGTQGPDARGAMPDASLVTIQVIVNRNLMVPNPRATLTSTGAGVPTGGGAGVGAPNAGRGV